MKCVVYLFMCFVWLVIAKWAGLEVAFATAFSWFFVELTEITSKIEDKE